MASPPVKSSAQVKTVLIGMILGVLMCGSWLFALWLYCFGRAIWNL